MPDAQCIILYIHCYSACDCILVTCIKHAYVYTACFLLCTWSECVWANWCWWLVSPTGFVSALSRAGLWPIWGATPAHLWHNIRITLLCFAYMYSTQWFVLQTLCCQLWPFVKECRIAIAHIGETRTDYNNYGMYCHGPVMFIRHTCTHKCRKGWQRKLECMDPRDHTNEQPKWWALYDASHCSRCTSNAAKAPDHPWSRCQDTMIASEGPLNQTFHIYGHFDLNLISSHSGYIVRLKEQ